VTDVPPIRREVVVELPPDEAFELFTARIGDWWPLAELSVFGAGTAVAFIDGKLVEASDGRTSVWGSVTEWEPGTRVSFTWHPGRDSDRASSVSVSFAPRQSEQTLVVLEHSGWEAFEDPAAARREYDRGWPTVLGRYRDAAARSADPHAYTWVALIHRPGPEAPSEGSIFEDPRFTEHAQFLSRMCQEGYLVAAGPMLDEHGAGMTILRLPGEGRLEEATHLATEEDRSVKGGFFEVSVRPWQVVMTG
jgi:uncharacterized protein YndB with AHSA1/START domain/uncharacterized protein YciI